MTLTSPFTWSSVIKGIVSIVFFILFYSFITCFVGLSCCHGLSPSLSAALAVSIIHHLHSPAIYTSFYSQSVFPLCWLHLSTLIQLFQPVCAALGCLWVLGLKQHHYRHLSAVEKRLCIHWLPRIKVTHPVTFKKTENVISPLLMAISCFYEEQWRPNYTAANAATTNVDVNCKTTDRFDWETVNLNFTDKITSA